MAKFVATYPVAPRGLGTAFTESETPVQYALVLKNRFVNAAGGAEKRPGMTELGNAVSGAPTLTGLHEFINESGTSILFTSGSGRIYRFDTPNFVDAYISAISTAPWSDIQMDGKLIFYNGVDRNLYTKDGTNFYELIALMEKGEATTGTDQSHLHDSDVTNWVTDTRITTNDLVHNLTQGGYGIITAVATASVAHTNISPTSTGIGIATATAAPGDRYEIIDLVELNVVPTDNPDDPDNVAVTDNSTSATGIYVSAVSDWTATAVRVGDYIRNTTRAAVTQVTTVAATYLGCASVAGQVAGDSLILMKSAMPIAKAAHVHFGRLYMVDARDERIIRVTGPNDPQDMSTDSGTIDSSSFKVGDEQPAGDSVKAMGSFQRFMVIAGKQNVFLYEGVDPIADTSAATTDFDVVGLFQQGAVSRRGLVAIGNDLAFITNDGVQSLSLVGDASTLGRTNLSEAVKTDMHDDIAATTEDKIIAINYPRRSWMILKIGAEMHVFNYSIYFGADEANKASGGMATLRFGSWSEFFGKFAEQLAFLVRQDGVLTCAGSGGHVYEYDQGNFHDAGTTFNTTYQTTWLTGEEPRRPVNVKEGKYIKPTFEIGSEDVIYTITVSAGYSAKSSDSITVTAVGNASKTIVSTKQPLRWRGEQFRITIETSASSGSDTIARFTVYGVSCGNE